MPPLTRDEVRAVDRRAIDDYGMSGLVLMENAGRGCAEILRSLGCGGPVIIVCGKGNNAGDGFVIGRHLDLRRIPVRFVLLFPSDALSADAAANYHVVERAGLSIIDLSRDFSRDRLEFELAGTEWIVDAVLGTGATGEPRFPLDAAIEAINAASARRLAVDLPSGLDCDTGQAARATVRADHTCTFVAEKVGFAAPAAREYLGQVHIVEIGVPRCLLDQVAANRTANQSTFCIQK